MRQKLKIKKYHLSPVNCHMSLTQQEASGKPKHLGFRASMVVELKLIKIIIHKDQNTQKKRQTIYKLKIFL